MYTHTHRMHTGPALCGCCFSWSARLAAVSSSGRAAGLAGKGSEGGRFCFALFFFTKGPTTVGQGRLRIAAADVARSWSAAAAAAAAASSFIASSSSSSPPPPLCPPSPPPALPLTLPPALGPAAGGTTSHGASMSGRRRITHRCGTTGRRGRGSRRGGAPWTPARRPSSRGSNDRDRRRWSTAQLCGRADKPQLITLTKTTPVW